MGIASKRSSGFESTQPLVPLPQEPKADSTTSNPITVCINGSLSTSKSPMHEVNDSSVSMALSAAVVVFLFFSITNLLFCCWWKRQSIKNCLAGGTKRWNNDDSSRTSLNKTLLRKFVTNPLYVSAASLELMPVPVLSGDSVVMLKTIGEGCFGSVYKGELKKTDGGTEMVAVKFLKEKVTRKTDEDFIREVDMVSRLKHENIITLIGIVSKDNENAPWMVFEFMPYGDLADVLRNNSNGFKRVLHGVQLTTKACLLKIGVQIAGGMRYLAEQRIVHNDLSCRNCLVGKGLVVKIADFGMSRDIATCDFYRIENQKLLPLRWMPPESLKYHRFTLESDVWSFGVVLWEIYSYGRQPYSGHGNNEVIKMIRDNVTLQRPSDCPTSVWHLMSECWNYDPENRIKFPEISARLNEMYEEAISSGYGGESLPEPLEMPVTSITPQ